MPSKQRPITAIITRTKNRPLLLERSIKSVLAQTSKDYVHVILNDGGDQDVVDEILKRLPDANRKVIHNKRSAGLTPALNQAIQATTSDYIAILDDDDSWMPDRVEKVTRYLIDNPTSPGVAVQMDRVIEKIEGSRVVELSREPWYPGVTEVRLYDQMLDNYLSNGCFTYRRVLYDELGGYDEDLEVAEDWDFGLRCLLKNDISFISGTLTLYHHRPEAVDSNGNSVFAGVDTHARNLTKLRNRYLRKDIANGVFGVGYIMNNLHHERDILAIQSKLRDEQTVRIEGHINQVGEGLKNTVESASLYRSLRNKIGS